MSSCISPNVNSDVFRNSGLQLHLLVFHPIYNGCIRGDAIKAIGDILSSSSIRRKDIV